MSRTGGRTPFDKLNALSGPCRVLWADPDDVTDIPSDLHEIVDQVADVDGEYPAKDGWSDFGLSADAPSYSHDKASDGLEYQQPTGVLFEQINSITRTFQAQIAEIDPENLKVIENTTLTEAVAASIAAAADDVRHSAQTLIHTGLYTSLRQFRIAVIAYRPSGSGEVIEAGSPPITRPAAVARVFPLCTLSADSTDIDISKGDPVNASVTFTILPDQTAGAGKEHGYWVIETPGTILA